MGKPAREVGRAPAKVIVPTFGAAIADGREFSMCSDASVAGPGSIEDHAGGATIAGLAGLDNVATSDPEILELGRIELQQPTERLATGARQLRAGEPGGKSTYRGDVRAGHN